VSCEVYLGEERASSILGSTCLPGWRTWIGGLPQNPTLDVSVESQVSQPWRGPSTALRVGYGAPGIPGEDASFARWTVKASVPM
jgi:hypothetical protein